MRAIAVTSPGQVAIVDTGIPTPGPYQALVKTELACVCNSTDGELVSGRFPGMEDAFPFALGHESVGVIEELDQSLAIGIGTDPHGETHRFGRALRAQ